MVFCHALIMDNSCMMKLQCDKVAEGHLLVIKKMIWETLVVPAFIQSSLIREKYSEFFPSQNLQCSLCFLPGSSRPSWSIRQRRKPWSTWADWASRCTGQHRRSRTRGRVTGSACRKCCWCQWLGFQPVVSLRLGF